MSLVGKLILIKYVIQAMPSNLLALTQPPMAIIEAINKIMSDFFWHDTSGQHKHHWTKYTTVCFPQEEGAVGLRSMNNIAKAYAIKL